MVEKVYCDSCLPEVIVALLTMHPSLDVHRWAIHDFPGGGKECVKCGRSAFLASSGLEYLTIVKETR